MKNGRMRAQSRPTSRAREKEHERIIRWQIGVVGSRIEESRGNGSPDEPSACWSSRRASQSECDEPAEMFDAKVKVLLGCQPGREQLTKGLVRIIYHRPRARRGEEEETDERRITREKISPPGRPLNVNPARSGDVAYISFGWRWVESSIRAMSMALMMQPRCRRGRPECVMHGRRPVRPGPRNKEDEEYPFRRPPGATAVITQSHLRTSKRRASIGDAAHLRKRIPLSLPHVGRHTDKRFFFISPLLSATPWWTITAKHNQWREYNKPCVHLSPTRLAFGTLNSIMHASFSGSEKNWNLNFASRRSRVVKRCQNHLSQWPVR